MDDRRVADYFVVAGLDHNQHLPLEEFNNETITKPSFRQDPITDITVINRSLGEKIPKGYECIEVTPTGFPANLNHGSIRCPDMFVCYKRGRDKPPLKDLGILYEGKERLMGGCEVVHTTLQGHPANVNNSNNSRIYLTYRRAEKSASSDTLVVVDVCVILGSKGEEPPLTFLKILKNLNKGMVGSDVFLCYKKAMVKTDVLAYRPSILGRYPAEDYKDFPLPDSVPMFCLPMGATIECWSAEAKHPVPSFSTFIFTGSAGEKVYGAAVSFYEEYKEEDLSDMQMRSLGLKNKSIREQYHILKTVHVRKSISLLSHWPLFDAFKKFLSQLYKISITGPHTVPIERHISHFMYDVPYPSPDRPRILVQLTHDTLSLCMPEDSPLPQSGASFITLLRNLGPELSMNLLLFVLLENKILLHSLRPTVLTEVAEAVTAMIFPFHWQCPYIPLCPLGLSVVLNAPCPFIVGVDSRYFDLYDPPPDVICVDLDTNRISTPEDKKTLNYKFLPKRATRVLHDSLMRLYEAASQYHVQPPDSEDMSLEMTHVDLDFRRKKQAMQLELAIQEVFLRFTASILKDYKNFLNPIMKQPTSQTTDASSLFDMQAFLKSRDKINAKFYSQLMKTQMFFRFIEERSFVSDKDASLAFFDECAEKVDDLRDEPKLIEIDTTKASEHTVFIMPPEPVGLPEGEIYRYNGFPVLKNELFLHKQKSSLSAPTKQISCPNSPLARRTKQEVKSAQKIAQLQVGNASSWSKCLQSYVFSLWFVAFPAFVHQHPKKMEALKIGFAVLKKMQEAKLRTTDEVCYRVLMQLAGQYNKPGLAVQVYSQMKKQGLHPNAITYGYYNKVMLEAEWPSPQSKARLRWLKIRNVIIGVAQFRRAVRRRSISLYSNSGSEYDRISHASEDSYLGELQGKDEGERLDVDDGRVVSVIHSSPAAEALINGKNHGSLEERMSTGEASDRGYNSMTQEDVKRMSQIVISTDDTGSASSPATSDNSDKAVKFRTDSWNPLGLFGSSSNNNKHRSHGEKVKKEVHIMEGESRHRESVIRPRVGSIVRKSKASSAAIDELELLKGSVLSNSAGLIMVSQVCLERGSCLPDTDLRVEVEKAKRKRHKSAGEKSSKPARSMSLFAGWRPPPVNVMTPEGSEHQPKVCLRFSELVKHEEDDVSLSSLHSNEEGKVKEVESNASEQILGERMSSNNTPVVMASGSVRSSQAQFAIDENEKLILDFDPLCGESQTDSVNASCTGHVQPATACDPNTNSSASADGASSSLPNISENSDLQENATEGHDENTDSTTAGANLSVPAVSRREMRRSVSVSEDRLSGNFNETPVKQSLSEIGRTFSSPGANVPVEPKTPEKQVAEDAQSVSSLTDSKKDRPTDFVLRRSQSLKKTNEAIGSFFKYASRAAFSKFNELKQTITTPIKNGSLGSLGSLTQSVEELDTNDGSSTSGTIRERLRYGGSQDLLSHSEESVQDEMDKRHSGLSFGSAPSPSYLEGYSNLKDVSSANVGASLEVLGDDMVNLALEVEMSSCSRCTVCNRLIYDEEIMAGWSAEDSNLNTSCPYCHAKFVPHLQIYIKDWRGQRKSILLNSDQSSTSTDRRLTHAMQGDGSLQTSQHSSCSPAPKDVLDMTGSPSEKNESTDHVDQESDSLEGLLPGVVDLTLEPSTEDPTHEAEVSPVMSSVKEETETAGAFTLTESGSKDFTSRSVCPSEPQVVHYLSPLVLRKEVESLLDHDGDLCLAAEAFVEEHPILFWNLVWYFRRVEVPTHLTGFLLSSKSFSFNKGKEMELYKNMYDTHNILVRPQWDNVRLHEEVGLPMYLAWQAGHSSTVVNALDIEADSFTKPMMTQIIENIKRDDLAASIKLVMNVRRRMQSNKRRFRSMYREILYLSFVACGRENIDHDAFDNAYQAAFAENLSPAEKRRLQLDDRPKSERVQLCRKVFSKLEI